MLMDAGKEEVGGGRAFSPGQQAGLRSGYVAFLIHMSCLKTGYVTIRMRSVQPVALAITYLYELNLGICYAATASTYI